MKFFACIEPFVCGIVPVSLHTLFIYAFYDNIANQKRAILFIYLYFMLQNKISGKVGVQVFLGPPVMPLTRF